MTLEELYNLANYIVKVRNKGKTLTPNKFEELWNRRQVDYFKEIYDNYEATTAITDVLRTFKTILDQSGATIIDDTYIILPSNYFHFTSMSYIDSDGVYYPFDMVTKSEVIMRKSSTITAPTTTHPICYEFGRPTLPDVLLYPEPYDNSLDFEITYLRYPTDVVLDYFVNSTGNFDYLEASEGHNWSDGQYDSNGNEQDSASVSVSGSYQYTSTTVEPEWNEDDQLKILEYILRDVGISIDQMGIYEYANIQKNES